MSHQLLTLLPAAMALLSALSFATPADAGGLIGTPNVAWLMTLIMIGFYPAAWPRGFAFFLGLLQDVLFATPLGAQAIIALLLAQAATLQRERQSPQFRLRWLEAAGMLVVAHLLLWAVMHLILDEAPGIGTLLRAGLASALWYPLFYLLATRLFRGLPDAK